MAAAAKEAAEAAAKELGIITDEGPSADEGEELLSPLSAPPDDAITDAGTAAAKNEVGGAVDGEDASASAGSAGSNSGTATPCWLLCTFEIRDTGTGMTPEAKATLFKK